jgi:hypothetical protein
MVKKLEVKTENSKVINGTLYITALLAQKLVSGQKALVDFSSKVNFPGIGQLVKYNGEYNRK